LNPLQPLQPLSNQYYGLRHGHSLANEAQLIISHPDHGVPQYGLSEVGRQQVVSALTAAIQNRLLDQTTLIVASDFARTQETAHIAADLLHAQEIILTPRLRERFFGAWEKQHTRHYQHVWDDDMLDGTHKHHGVESTREVLARTTALVTDLEADYSGRTILLVSHGDVLQILQTAFEGIDSAHHRLLPPLETGQVRKLDLKSVRSAGPDLSPRRRQGRKRS
jgi:probable phosphoglycerate mutase